MSPALVRVLAAALLLLVGVGYVLTNRTGKDLAGPAADAPEAQVDAPEDQQETAHSAPADPSDTPNPDTSAASQPEGAESPGSEELAADVLESSPAPAEPQDSPFTATDPDAAGDQPANATDMAAQPDNPTLATEPSGAEPRASSRAVREPGEVIAVPESYPVTEAARYFVPREERRPGNLGGPPPLDFPGGPSDPNRLDGDGLAPPPAPGQ